MTPTARHATRRQYAEGMKGRVRLEKKNGDVVGVLLYVLELVHINRS